MSIDDQLGNIPSITEGNRSLQYFTGRHDFIRLFSGCLNQDPAESQILFFHGDGGNGKSLLLRVLQERYCKRLLPETWQELSQGTNAELAEWVAGLKPGNYLPVAAVCHDFGLTGGIDQPQDPFYGLLQLRRNLGKAVTSPYRLKFPLYDFACIWYLRQQGKSPEQIKELFPLTEAAGVISTLIDVVSKTSVGAMGKAVLDFFTKQWGQELTVYLARTGLKKEDIEAICQQDLNTELIYELPRLFAQDLNAAMSASNVPKRVVLFFDTYEAFWGQQKNLPDQLFFERDEWLRKLLRALELEAGIVIVVAGRELPRWSTAGKVKQNTEIPAQYLRAKQVGHLSAEEAMDYLQRVGIQERSLRESMMAYASVEIGQVHPLYLGLCADVVLQAQNQGTMLTAKDFADVPEVGDKASVLVARLLKYVDQNMKFAVHGLSACRAFDFDLYNLLGERLKFRPSCPDFDLLTAFSFVWRTERQGQSWYKIHDLIRRIDDEKKNEQTQQAHQILGDYYQGEEEWAEAIYHVNRLDWEAGVAQWQKFFEEALQYGRYDLCRTFLEVRSELFVKSEFWLGLVSATEGDYYAQVSLHQAALQEYSEAINFHDAALSKVPNDIQVLNNKGKALSKLADLQADLSQHSDALTSYQKAIDSYDAALSKAPDDIRVLNNKGNTLERKADLQAGLSQHSDALQSCQEAIASYDAALSKVPDDIYALNNKGNALLSLADLQALQAGLSQHSDALTSYQKAIDSYDAALSKAPDYIIALNNKGIALKRLADLQASLSQYSDALQSYQKAIDSYDAALGKAPDHINALNNRGNALSKLADFQAIHLQHFAALQSYYEAIASYDAALGKAPDYIKVLNNKGNALRRLADLQVGLSQHSDALQSYREAIVSHNAALGKAPDDIYALKGLGGTYINLGQMLMKLSEGTEAFTCLSNALTALGRSLELAPNDPEIQAAYDKLRKLF